MIVTNRFSLSYLLDVVELTSEPVVRLDGGRITFEVLVHDGDECRMVRECIYTHAGTHVSTHRLTLPPHSNPPSRRGMQSAKCSIRHLVRIHPGVIRTQLRATGVGRLEGGKNGIGVVTISITCFLTLTPALTLTFTLTHILTLVVPSPILILAIALTLTPLLERLNRQPPRYHHRHYHRHHYRQDRQAHRLHYRTYWGW